MFRCNCPINKILINCSLTKHATNKNTNNIRQSYNEIPLCTGSLTIEAAVVYPLAIGFFIFILFFFRILQVQTAVYSALSIAARKSAVVSAYDVKPAEIAIKELYFRKELAGNELVGRYVTGGIWGIVLLETEEEEYLQLSARYYIRSPVSFFLKKGFGFHQQVKQRKWTGKSTKDVEKKAYVYVTDYGEVYHLSMACHYLDLSIHTVKLRNIADLRNQNEHKYSACTICAAKVSLNEEVYITDYGEVYHSKRNCSGLKRTIKIVSLDEVGKRSLCKKCEGVYGRVN